MLIAAVVAGVMALGAGEVRGQSLVNVWSQRDTPTGMMNIPEQAVAMEYWTDLQASPSERNILFVTGWGVHPVTQQPFIATYKYNVDGETEQARRLAGPVFFPPPTMNMASKPAALVVDRETGDVYIVGWASNPGQGRTDTDYIILKYDKDLTPSIGWEPQAPYGLAGVRHFDGDAHGDDRAVDAAFVPTAVAQARLYVTGTSWGQQTGNDIVTLRIEPSNGDQKWMHRYHPPGNAGSGSDEAVRIVYALATAPGEGVGAHPIVAGTSYGGSGQGLDYLAIFYHDLPTSVSLQEILWPPQHPDAGGVRRWNGPGSGDDVCVGMEGQPSGERSQISGLIALCGSTTPPPSGPGADTDYGVWAVNISNGGTVFAQTFDGGDKEKSDDVATAVAVVGTSVWVTGSIRNGSAYDIATLLISAHPASPGTILGYHIFGQPDLDDEQAVDILHGLGTNVYIAGSLYNATGNYYSYLVLKYSFPSPSGLEAAQWWEGGVFQRANAMRVHIDGENDGVYVTGTTTWEDFSLDYLTIRLMP